MTSLLVSRGIAVVCFAVLLGGCAGFVPHPGPGAEPGGDYRPLTLPVIALGDTQEHLATGYPLHDNDSAVDAYVEVAQRPPEQTLFGRRVMEWVLTAHPTEPFLHLGDVMDLSCRIEAVRMTKIFRAAIEPGAILPGNHDGLMFGIYAYDLRSGKLDTNVQNWNAACRRGARDEDLKHKTGSEALTKRDFISQYIKEHLNARPPKRGLTAPPDTGSHSVNWRNPEPNAFLAGIAAELLDGAVYADSFLAQRLRLPRAPEATRNTYIIALDTNQAGLLVSAWDTIMGRSPGSVGHINHDQIRAIGTWVDESVRNGDIVIFAGHHNWSSLGLPTRFRLRALMRKLKHPLVYLSAHTHRGFWAEHRTQGQQPLLELNVSSLSDWPLAYRQISFAYDESKRRLQIKGDLLPRGAWPTATYADLLAAWETQTCKHLAVTTARIREEDLAMVKKQRESRGTLMEWMLEGLSPICESCEQLMYKHAQSYLNELLEIVLQLDRDLGRQAHYLHTLTLPPWCGSSDFTDCTRVLLSEQPVDFKAHVRLFRRKAAMVALFNDHLDDLSDSGARAYMTCRAVQAAKIDFDLTDEKRNNFRGEDRRASEQFFRTDASIGME